MTVRIQKYGGATLTSPDLVRAAAGRIAATFASGLSVVVCVSAMGHETDALLALAPGVPAGRELDLLVTSGEQKAVALVCLALQELGVRAEGFTGARAGIETDLRPTTASIVGVHPHRLRASRAAGRVPVVCGAQGATRKREIAFLGRGGSDTSAVALAAALHADVCELYTDVDGVFTADPRIVADARLVPELGYEQLIAMGRAGCPKPATRAVELARDRRVTLRVRPAFGSGEGTLVAARCVGGEVAVVSQPAGRDDGPVAADDGRCVVSVIGAARSAGRVR